MPEPRTSSETSREVIDHLSGAAHRTADHAPPLPRLIASLRGLGLFGSTVGPIVLARAPGRLDVMGGIADYSGATVCEMPLAIAAGAAVQRRADGQVVCRSAQAGRCVAVAFDQLMTDDPLAVRALCEGEDEWARYAVGCVWWLLHHPHDGMRTSDAAQRPTGITIAIDSDVPLGGGVSSSAAIEVAVMTSLCALMHIDLPPMQLAAACQAVENRVVGAPCGVMDQVTAVLGRAQTMIEIDCQPDAHGLPAQVRGEVPVPAGCAFIGIHSGVRHEVKGDPYTDTRVAAFMGQKILSTLETPDLTRGHLANVSAGRFIGELQHKLPTTMLGQAFLDQYTATPDTVTRVLPNKHYAVRAATSHHVLESQRVREFIAVMRAVEADDAADRAQQLRQAGRLMLESHASYRDNAALGHAMTDRLVALAQEIGPDRGVFGAKITGGGCGGTVAMLIRDDTATHERVAALRQAYTAETGRATQLFEGSGPGATATGAAQIRYEELP